MDSRRIFKVLIKLTFTSMVVGLVAILVGWEKVIVAVQEASVFWIVALLGAVAASRVIEAVQMHVLLSKVEVKLSVARIFLANALSGLYSLVLPGDVFASAAKWAVLSAATGKKSLILSAIVYNRMALLLPMTAIGAIALAFDNPFANPAILAILLIVTMLGVGVVFLLFHPTLGTHGERIIRRMTKPLTEKFQTMVERVLGSLEGFQEFRLRDHLMVYGVSLLSFLSSVVIMGCAMWALGISLSLVVLFWITAIVTSARLIPLTVSNLGVREGILILVLGFYGVEPERAFTVGILLFTGHLLIAFIGLIYQIALSVGWVHSGNSFKMQAS